MTAAGQAAEWPDWTSAALRSLDEQAVHVLRVPLRLSLPLQPDEWAPLDRDEVQRGRRYAFDPPRIRFVRCRSALRCALGRLISCAPEDVRFEHGPHGRPFLPSELNPAGLDFNVSHSGDWGLVAWTWRRTLGVDIECHDRRTTWRGLAERFFSPAEADALFALPDHLQLAGFYRVWTGKEAYIKALGRGLSFPLQSFTVSADPRTAPALLDVAGAADEAERWSLAALPVAANYSAMVLWDRGPAAVQRWTWRSAAACE